jgi:hypothetical protein
MVNLSLWDPVLEFVTLTTSEGVVLPSPSLKHSTPTSEEEKQAPIFEEVTLATVTEYTTSVTPDVVGTVAYVMFVYDVSKFTSPLTLFRFTSFVPSEKESVNPGLGSAPDGGE